MLISLKVSTVITVPVFAQLRANIVKFVTDVWQILIIIVFGSTTVLDQTTIVHFLSLFWPLFAISLRS